MPEIQGLCSVSETDDFVLVRIGDELGNEPWAQVHSVLEDLIPQLLKASSRRVLLDLTTLNQTGSAVVAAVIRIWRKIQEKDGKVVVLAPQLETRTTFAVAGLLTQIDFVREFGEAWDRLGLSRSAKLTRRETNLLKAIAPLAATSAIAALVILLLSLTPVLYRPSILFSFVVSALLACTGGWVAATRDTGGLRHMSRMASAAGVISLLTAISHWAV